MDSLWTPSQRVGWPIKHRNSMLSKPVTSPARKGNQHLYAVCAWLTNLPVTVGYCRDTSPNNTDELKATINAIWTSITPQQCHRLIASMPGLTDAVITGAQTEHGVKNETYFTLHSKELNKINLHHQQVFYGQPQYSWNTYHIIPFPKKTKQGTW